MHPPAAAHAFSQWPSQRVHLPNLNEHTSEKQAHCANYDHYTLAAAMNPCPWSFYGEVVRPWTCSADRVTIYQKSITDPLLERIDIHFDVLRVKFDKLSDHRLGELSDAA